jgi:hypothetical protein
MIFSINQQNSSSANTKTISETNVVRKHKAEAEEAGEVIVKKRERPPKAATDQAELKPGRKAPIHVINSIVPMKKFKK